MLFLICFFINWNIISFISIPFLLRLDLFVPKFKTIYSEFFIFLLTAWSVGGSTSQKDIVELS